MPSIPAPVLYDGSDLYSWVVYLAAFSYIEYGLYLFVYNPRGIFLPIRDLVYEVFVNQPSIQLAWLLCAMWLGKFHWPESLRSFYGRLMLSLLTSFSYISFFQYGAVTNEGYGTCILIGLYLLALIWIECELRLSRYSPSSYARLFTRFLFSFGIFGLSIAGRYTYVPPKFILSLNWPEYGSLTAVEYIAMGIPFAIVLLWSGLVGATLSQHLKLPTWFAKVVGGLAPVLIMVSLFISAFVMKSFGDLVDVLLGIVVISSLPMVVFTVYCIYRPIVFHIC